MVSDEDMIRFHNGDTLDSIPVVRVTPDTPARPVMNRQLWGLALGSALAAGAVVGLVLASMDDSPAPARAALASVTPSPGPSPSVVTATATVTARATVIAPHPYTEPENERVYVLTTPATGGDPGMDYCFQYNGQGADLLVNAPAYMCQDFLFSTHPDDGEGVFEDSPPDCSDTPGARSARLQFSPQSFWGEGVMYTCLLVNDGA